MQTTSALLRLVSASVASLAVAGTALAQDGFTPVEDDWFEFIIPTLATDATAGTPIDLSHLNAQPAGSNGFLRNDGQGNLVDEQGNVVRLFGTNICDWHAMPPKHLARPIAQRLQQLGVNFIRLHYYELGSAPQFIMQPNMSDVDAEKRDEMFNLIAELKAAGIYVDVNLHVARPVPGTPENWSNPMSKGIDRVLPDLVEDGKHFARQILAVENPYTGLTLAEDPAIVAVEINNENSLMQGFWNTLATLRGEPGRLVQDKWNAWLLEKYGSTDALRAVWNGNLPPTGADVIRNGNFATGGDHFEAEFGSGASGKTEVLREDGKSFLRWTATEPGLDIWNLQLHQANLPVEHGKSYVLRFKVRTPSDTAPALFVHLMRQGGDWGLASSDVQVVPRQQWQEVVASWTVDNDTEEGVRLSFDLHNETGTIDIAEVSLTEGALPGLDETASLEEATVPLPGMAGNGRSIADWRAFCIELDLAYTEEMVDFLRDDLGVKSMIWDTQVNYGGGVGMVREATLSDAVDIHGYPSHPQFLGMHEGERLNRVEHKSILGEGFDSWAGLSLWQAKDMPFFATEFDLNPPNFYHSESYPLLTLLATYQGWDGIGEYAWLNFQGLDEDAYSPVTLSNHYHTSGNPTQVAFMPTSALLMRQQLVTPAGDAVTLTIPTTYLLEEAGLDWEAISDAWGQHDIGNHSALLQKLQVELAEDETATRIVGNVAAADSDGVLVSDTGEIRIDRSETGKETLAVVAPQIRMSFGHFAGQPMELGDVTISLEEGGMPDGDYANISLISLDGASIDQSRKLLLTAVARGASPDWYFQDEALTTSTMSGDAAVRLEPVRLKLELPASGWTVTALRPTGERGEVIDFAQGVIDTASAESVWFLLER